MFIVSHAKRYLSKIPQLRRPLNQGIRKDKPKYNSKVAKTIINNIKSIAARKAISDLPGADLDESIQQGESSFISESIQEATESSSKRRNNKTKTFLLFSDHVTSLCWKCCDDLTSEFIDWTKCARCLRWNHHLCLSIYYIL